MSAVDKVVTWVREAINIRSQLRQSRARLTESAERHKAGALAVARQSVVDLNSSVVVHDMMAEVNRKLQR